MVESSERQFLGASGGHRNSPGAAPVSAGPGGGTSQTVRKHSPAAVVIALIPFAAMCFSVPLWDRIAPMMLGLPFNLFWLVSWQVLSVFCLAIAYRLESAHERRRDRAESEERR